MKNFLLVVSNKFPANFTGTTLHPVMKAMMQEAIIDLFRKNESLASYTIGETVLHLSRKIRQGGPLVNNFHRSLSHNNMFIPVPNKVTYTGTPFFAAFLEGMRGFFEGALEHGESTKNMQVIYLANNSRARDNPLLGQLLQRGMTASLHSTRVHYAEKEHFLLAIATKALFIHDGSSPGIKRMMNQLPLFTRDMVQGSRSFMELDLSSFYYGPVRYFPEDECRKQ